MAARLAELDGEVRGDRTLGASGRDGARPPSPYGAGQLISSGWVTRFEHRRVFSTQRDRPARYSLAGDWYISATASFAKSGFQDLSRKSPFTHQAAARIPFRR